MKEKNFSDKLADLVFLNGGFTVRLDNETPKEGYIVGHTKLSVQKDYASQEQVLSWYDKVLESKNLYLGAWRDSETGLIHYDISEHVPTYKEAFILANRRNELAIWDLRTETEIRF